MPALAVPATGRRAATFAARGHIALNPASEQVEGFSSVAWFLLNAGAARSGLDGPSSIVCAQALPNTVRAKMWAPYSPSDGRGAIASRLIALLEAFTSCIPLAIFVALMSLISKVRGQVQSQLSWAMAAPLIGCAAFSLVAGQNSFGPLGRMQLFALPFLLLALGAQLDRALVGRPPRQRLLILLSCSALSVVEGWAISATGTMRALAGAPEANGAVSVADVAAKGKAVDEFRRALKLPAFTFMTPDIGGVGLCCDRLRVVDIGLLANQRLPHEGYSAIAAVLRAERPDVIDVHIPWTRFSGLPAMTEFQRGYTAIGGHGLYIRNDRFRSLTARSALSPLQTR